MFKKDAYDLVCRFLVENCITNVNCTMIGIKGQYDTKISCPAFKRCRYRLEYPRNNNGCLEIIKKYFREYSDLINYYERKERENNDN